MVAAAEQQGLERRRAEELAELAIALHDETTVDETVDMVLDYARSAIGCDLAGVTLIQGRNRLESTAATDELVEKLTLLEVECGEGPDLDVTARGIAIVVRDTVSDSRWPTWSASVAALGVRSCVSVPMSTSLKAVGTLSLFAYEPDRFSFDDLNVTQLLARHAAVALSTAQRTEDLWLAVDARKLVGQAQGIVMERYSLNAEQAFSVLMRYSQQNNVKLRTLAHHVVNDRKLI